eukprot:19404-Heterococcus_DN1.PRE.1
MPVPLTVSMLDVPALPATIVSLIPVMLLHTLPLTGDRASIKALLTGLILRLVVTIALSKGDAIQDL